jgi:hypothetical protein
MIEITGKGIGVALASKMAKPALPSATQRSG